MAKKKQHGGKRSGAGRPVSPDGPAQVIAASVPKGLLVRLDTLAKVRGWNRSQAVTEAVRGLVAQNKRVR